VTYEFELVLAGHEVMTVDMGDALVAAGCDDSTTGSTGGMAFVAFDRDAPGLEEAIRSAIADVEKAGFRVAEVRMAPESLALVGGQG
jgi:hypothetical protein